MTVPATPTTGISVDTAIAPRKGLVRRLLAEPMAVIPTIILLAIIAISVFAPWLAPFAPDYVRIHLANEPPFQSEFLLGGDQAGRDVLSRLLYAGSLTLIGALITVVVSVALGVTTGLIAGYVRGAFDAAASWIANVVLVMPSKIILVALFAVVGPNTLVTMTVLGVMVAPAFFRLVRNLVIGVKNELYVDAARVSGLSDFRIISRHVLSVVRAPIIIQAAFIAGIAVVLQAGLEFIGLGDPSTPRGAACCKTRSSPSTPRPPC
ncbi:ABC transporter permease [Microbacterium sp. NIBRBAC000506063]|uniref:ABC transporter permease n=1 Tax=Microbacterium sp. NIBRBAC000506063 TaxID=2734618 RepID=UPI001BB6B2EA|nr:ABC transporter permease [Microbacterium sp. NIBRBAC000506063]QTV79113.1 ABC transporter permease [Microbacterium sp. NIBRBAC000506063]